MGKDISLILPIYNETSRLVSGLSNILSYLGETGQNSKFGKELTWEIILVDDGSTIPTAQIINESSLKLPLTRLQDQQKFRGIRLSENKGKGAAIAKGVAEATGKYIVFSDIDGSVPIQVLPTFLRELKNHDIAIASRRIDKSIIAVHQPFIREFGGRMYTYLSQHLFGLKIHDATCGFKAFRGSVAKELFGSSKIERWAFDTEILFLAKEQKFRLTEVPVVWENKEGSKVKPLDTVESFLDLLRILWYQKTGQYDMKIENRKKKIEDMNKKGTLSSQFSAQSSVCDTCGGNAFTFLFDHHQNWKVQQCTNCGLVQVIPRPSRKEVAALYDNDEAHFDPYIEQESVHRSYFRQKLATCYSLLAASSNSRKYQVISSKQQKKFTILDVGCLTGVLLDEAKLQGMQAEGLDISRDAVSYCNKRGLKAYVGTLEQFAKKNKAKKYDAITALEIIEHEYSPMSLISTMYRMLNKNGIAMVTTPNHGSWWRSLMGKKWPGYTHPEHLYFFDPKSLEHLFRSVGFREIVVTTGDSRPFPLWFLFQRGADYFPQFAGILKLLGQVMKPLPLKNPINPWDDLLIIARK